jgi:8-oxo-dGTP pyrophosphatase MutT (NUDIX family)
MAKKHVWLFKQSAVVPFRTKNGVTEVVLVTSSSNKNWVIPKGRIEKLMSPENSAAKEAFEEAGVIGDVSKNAFTDYKYSKRGNKCRVSVYPLEVSKILAEWDEMDKRDRRILEVGAAIQLIKKEQKGILRKFQKMINLSLDYQATE